MGTIEIRERIYEGGYDKDDTRTIPYRNLFKACEIFVKLIFVYFGLKLK